MKPLLPRIPNVHVWGQLKTFQSFLERSKGMRVTRSEIWSVGKVFQCLKTQPVNCWCKRSWYTSLTHFTEMEFVVNNLISRTVTDVSNQWELAYLL
ncbi:hypothetical protein TNIN_435721 [Trichonephila inaurata madagascariensis]|uniref:Uncharacterized protein n=1 Tax=Trichonephila inaurata madagascariensis TaxID=2747483 RepID=A0A8X6M865_9ARAC|nr:hypothetical protein TNIN_435721 [Trichonephila inaurata madagascariensis]